MEIGHSKSAEQGGRVHWDDFRAFVAIAKSCSINRAANELGTTQSSLSKRLARLENHLRVRLLERGPTGTILTYQGERVYARLLAAEKEIRAASVDARVADSRVEGDCSLLMGDGVANYWFAPFLSPFFDHYPGIALKVVLDHDLGAARNQVFDIRLHYYEPVDPSQVRRPLATIHFVPFASRRYIDKHGRPTSVAAMKDHRIIDQAQYLQEKGAWSSWAADEVVQRTALFTNQSAFLARCIRDGVGVGLMPTYVAIFDNELVPLDIGIRLPAKLYASYHRERVSMQPAKTTLSFLRTVVFDPKTMPWFAEELQFPSDDWRERYHNTMSSLGPSVPMN